MKYYLSRQMTIHNDAHMHATKQARERDVYDDLLVSEIGEALAAYHSPGKLHRALDMVIAADVFVYTGELAPMFSEYVCFYVYM